MVFSFKSETIGTSSLQYTLFFIRNHFIRNYTVQPKNGGKNKNLVSLCSEFKETFLRQNGSVSVLCSVLCHKIIYIFFTFLRIMTLLASLSHADLFPFLRALWRFLDIFINFHQIFLKIRNT